MTKKIGLFLLLSASVMLSACGDTNSSNNIPKVAAPYQKSFKEAWDIAGKGQVPTYACAVVVGTADSTLKYGQGDKAEAVQAYEACYVDAFVKFANVYMAQTDNAKLDSSNRPQGCNKIIVSFAIHSGALGEFVDTFDLDKKTLNEKVRAGLTEPASLCPDLITRP